MESYEEEIGNFNEFSTPDPPGVPIAEVLAQPIVIIPDIIPVADAAKWTNIPIDSSTDELLGRRGDKKKSMISNFLGSRADHQKIPPDIANNPSPAVFFFLFMNKDVVEKFTEATNSYADIVNPKY